MLQLLAMIHFGAVAVLAQSPDLTFAPAANGQFAFDTGPAFSTTGSTVEVNAADRPELMALQWGGFNPLRADGTSRYWDPQQLIDLGPASVCVIYRPRKPSGERWYNTGMIPPKLLLRTLAETQPELKECHQHGIGVIGYADSILFHPDMLASDGLAAEGLEAVDAGANPVVNREWDKSGAHVSCINNPRWLDLQKAVASVTAEAGFDGLQFDVYPYAISPGYLCHCEHCLRGWGMYCREKLGTSEPMPGDSGLLDFDKPADRALLQWRWQAFADFVKAIEAHVHRRHPKFIIIMNHAGGTPDFMCEAARGGLDWPSSELGALKLGDQSSLYLYQMSAAVSQGRLIGLINAMEQIQPDYRYRVALAEALAGGGTFYLTPGSAEGPGPARISHEYCRFVRENREWLAGSQCEASCALLYSWRDQAFLQGDRKQASLASLDHPGKSFRRAAAVLASRHIPYDCVVMEKGLTAQQLARYPVIVAPELKLVDDLPAECLKQYVQAGGHLLALGNVGELREIRGQYARRDPSLLGAWNGRSTDGDWQTKLGRGRMAFVRQFTGQGAEESPQPTPAFENAAEFLGLGSRLIIRSASPMESTVRGHGSLRTLFLIRLGPLERATDLSVHVDYQLPRNLHVQQTYIASPGLSSGELAASWRESAGQFHMDIGQLNHFVLVGLRLSSSSP